MAVSARLDGATLPLVRAVARAGHWCANPDNRADLVHRLAHRTYLNLDVDLIDRAFRSVAVLDAAGATRPMPRPLDVGAGVQEPRVEAVHWLVAQMRASRQIPQDGRPEVEAAAVFRPDLYRAAMAL